ncbi:MAG: omptin family outer membrane protease [Hyphomicrobium sp.]|uniref:omptin family outer membrane protease n=1 Tax=Hyphomicrobium sp. TaxID=82 RepID=UPI001320FD18|nr:omptin family outer membrane protease [Hyphomicrobium sp.]KAB2942566.1 MAG: omptin family outer membrane protease [Hyphomicrobium sp.]MBZ0208541.1 omptin family outer membrane protease [Hyphomicrobium sp.]
MLHRVPTLSVFVLAMHCAGTSAGAQTSSPKATRQYNNVALEASIGLMQGEANEYVYRADNSKVSQLVWAFDNVAVFNGGIAITPLNWLALGARFRTKISDSSTMDDYDWTRPGDTDRCLATDDFCHSHHNDTTLTNYLSVDAYMAAIFYETDTIALTALVGYKRDSQAWQARGGWANYTTFAPGQLVISYEQNWQAPYLGLQFNGEWHRWTVQGRVIGSWWVGGKDEDNHHLRTLLFTEHFGESNMVGANAHVGYRLTPNLMLKGEYDLQQWDLAKGLSSELNYTSGVVESSGWNAAGAQSITQTVSFGAILEY